MYGIRINKVTKGEMRVKLSVSHRSTGQSRYEVRIPVMGEDTPYYTTVTLQALPQTSRYPTNIRATDLVTMVVNHLDEAMFPQVTSTDDLAEKDKRAKVLDLAYDCIELARKLERMMKKLDRLSSSAE